MVDSIKIQNQEYKGRVLTVLLELVLTQVVVEIGEGCSILLFDNLLIHIGSRRLHCCTVLSLKGNATNCLSILLEDGLLSVHLLEYRRLQELPSLLGLALGLLKLELLTEVNLNP
jgi:hypothetical protein